MKNFISFLIEAKTNKSIVFSFTRMNPPHAGHAELVKVVQFLANKHKCHHEVVLTDSHDHNRNPLYPKEKLKHVKRMFPTTNVVMADRKEPSIFHHVKRLNKEGYNHIIVVAGSDRLPEYKNLLTRYNGKEYKYDKMDFITSGKRDPDSKTISGVSGSKLRKLVKDNDFKSFRKSLPNTTRDSHAKDLFRNLKKNLH